MNKLVLSTSVATLLAMGAVGYGQITPAPAPAAETGGRYTVVAWNDLGMHCMDHDYSVFAILPPYNNLHAQLLDTYSGKLLSEGVTMTYEATPDTNNSLNSTSIGKTNFWDWAPALFGASPSPDLGLAGNPVQSLVPARMTYDATNGYWKADGIPATPYDDQGNPNYYPMVKVVAQDRLGHTLATTKTVLPVSDEMTCLMCHISGTGDPMAQPAPDWVYDLNPDKDWKRNILLLHDNRNLANPLYQQALQDKGYNAAGLLATSDGGQPILCAACHASNALGAPGYAGVKPLTESVHSWHGQRVMDDSTGMPMDLTTNRGVCYYCHPGSTTQCLRGIMGIAKAPSGELLLQCQSCHGSMSKVGTAGRVGWVDLPKCQNCHYWSDATQGYVRDTSVFDANGAFREAPGIFSSGASLYKVAGAGGHGKVQCEACHGSTHAEYATATANDNVQSTLLQGHPGTIAECSACHVQPFPMTSNGGPHGLHTLGQAWVDSHGLFAKQDRSHCRECHGADLQGTPQSKAFSPRFLYSFGGYKRLDQGQPVSCSGCHYGPFKLNNIPTNIRLSNTAIDPGLPAGSAIGTLRATDLDLGDAHTYSLVTDPNACSTADGNASFRISGDTLESAAPFDPAIKRRYNICVQTSDSRLATFTKPFTITVNKLGNPTLTATFASQGAQDGWLLESGETTTTGGTLNATATTFRLGDDWANKQYRAILSFDTQALPDDALVSKVTLRIQKQGQVGAHHFSSLGGITLDLLSPPLAADLQPGDFQVPPLQGQVGLINDFAEAGWYSTILNANAYPLLNLAGTTRFRLQFQKDDNNNRLTDYLAFFSGNAPATARPTLLVEYHLP